MKDALVAFERLIKRTLAPSLAFLAVLVLADLFVPTSVVGLLIERVRKGWGGQVEVPAEALPWLLAALVVGWSFVLAVLVEIFLDSFHYGSFASRVPPFGKNSETFRELRERVLEKMGRHPDLKHLVQHEWTDYHLYEIVGGIDRSPTHSFVDSAKTVGLVCVSGVVVFGSLVIWSDPWPSAEPAVGHRALFSLIAIFAAVAGHQGMKALYRARNTRLYVNFLMMPDETVAAILRDFEHRGRQPGKEAGDGSGG